jgi:hypothetical protein
MNPDILWPSDHDLAVAPETAAIAMLDAVLAVTISTLLAANPELPLCQGTTPPEVPPYPARQAAILLARVHSLRASLRRYHHATAIQPLEPDDEPDPF